MTLAKNNIIKVSPEYYKYNPELKLPCKTDNTNPYFSMVNKQLSNSKEYFKRIRTKLVKREFFGFIERFKKNPLTAIRHYVKYFKVTHLKKLIS